MASKVYLIFFTFIVILCLHYMGGLISVGNNDINSQAISDLTKQRTKLNEEIVALQQVVQQLRKVDISNFEYNEPNQVVAQGIPSTWQQPPQYQQQIPLVPPSPPMPLSLRQATLTSSSSSSSLPPTVSIKKQISSKTFPPETTTKQSIIIKNENGNIPVIYEGKKTPSSWRDFPCALRNFKKAQVTKTCEIDCDDSKCQKPLTVCEGYVECHGIVIKEKTRGQSLENAVAVLKSDSARSRDNSMQLLEASSWWQSKIITITIKPRHYIVNSYGGCGSKMMAGWLSQLPAMYKKSANHYHDPSPPLQLHSMGTKGIANPSMKGSKNDYRSGRFPGGSKFKEDTELVPSSGIDDYRIIFIYKDPVEALVSRYGYGHCMHIMGDCGKSEATWPKLDVYATQQMDRMKLIPHFDTYLNPKNKRNYPIIAINYHRIWDNLPALMTALGLPQSLIKTFPPRTETVRNDLTGKAEGNKAHTEKTRNDLKKIYQPLIDKIQKNPAVLIV